MAKQYAWLINLRLLETVCLHDAVAGSPGQYEPVGVDATIVALNVSRILRTAGHSLPVDCTPVQQRDENNQDKIISIHITWENLHVEDPASKPMIDLLSGRFLSGAANGTRSSRSAGAGGGASPSQGGGSPSRRRPPASPTSGRIGKRGSRAAPSTIPDGVSSEKSVRSLRPTKLQNKMVQVQQAAVNAIMDDADEAAVVQPPYAVFYVEPHILWPNGGIAAFVQLPFMLDDSWVGMGMYSATCSKFICQDQPGETGAIYSLRFELKTIPPGTAISAHAAVADAAGERATGDRAAVVTAPTAAAVAADALAGGVTPSLHATAGAPADRVLTPLPAAPVTPVTSVPLDSPNSPTGSPATDRLACSLARATRGSPPSGSGSGSVAPPRGAGAPGVPAAAADGRIEVAGTPLAGSSSPADGEADDDGGSPPPSGSQADGLSNVAGESPVGLAALLPDAALTATPVSGAPLAALHNMYLKMMGETNTGLGLLDEETVVMRPVKRSPPSTFALTTKFFSSLEISTNPAECKKANTKEYLMAAFPALPDAEQAALLLQ